MVMISWVFEFRSPKRVIVQEVVAPVDGDVVTHGGAAGFLPTRGEATTARSRVPREHIDQSPSGERLPRQAGWEVVAVVGGVLADVVAGTAP